MAIGMFVQTLYVLVDLYYVGKLGEHSLAGVSAGANLFMLVIALTQILNVGTSTLISHAVGRKDQSDANLVFNQSLVISGVMILVILLMGYGLGGVYMDSLSMDDTVRSEGRSYLWYVLPGLALQFSIVTMAAALRGTGIVKPVMMVQMISVLINIALTPVLIHGWLTGYALGVEGAGLASTIATLIAVVILWHYFVKKEHYVGVNRQMFKPDLATYKRLLKIGFPSGAEFLLMFAYMALIYWAIQGFGASATAGFGLGSRIMQSLLLPAMAVAFALPAVAGQNFGAQLPHRVKDAFKWSVLLSGSLMAVLMSLCLLNPELFVSNFSDDTGVLAVSTGFIGIICLNFIPSGVIFSCTGTFQGVGNTWPGLWSSATRMLTFAVPLIWLAQQPDFQIEQVWYLSVATIFIQSVLSLLLVRRELKNKLAFDVTPA